jgi:hypothetical protein
MRGTGRGLQAQTRGTGRELFARLQLWAQTRRAQSQVNGHGWVGPGANTVSSRGRKAIRAQPLRWGHVSGHGRVRHRARARTGACCREGERTRLPKGCTRLRGRGYKLTLPLLYFCQSLFQISSLSQHAQRALQGIVVWEVGP